MISTINKLYWKKLSEKKLNDYGFCQTLQRTFQHPNKKVSGNFIVLNCCDSVQMIAETEDKKIILVNQFRFGSEELSLELPAGRLEKNESPIEGAIRELREETGYAGNNPQILAILYTNPAIIKNKIYVVKIENCKKLYTPSFDQFEAIETQIVDKIQIEQLISDKKITNCITISAFKFL